MYHVKSFLVATVVFLSLDFLWLGYLGKAFYIKHMGEFLRLEGNNIVPNYAAAAVVYVALIGGILLFVLPKANNDPFAALWWGALFGFVTYATYDFTNLAVIAKWPLWVSIIDVIWGCVICAVTSCITTLLVKH